METTQCDAVAFNASKRELFTINTRYKSMQRRLRAQWTIRGMKDKLTLEKLNGVRLWITVGPREKFSTSELEALKDYLDGGGNVMVLLGEGGETKYETNINFFLEDLGIMVNNDAVARNVYHRHLHPKEALVSDGVLNREVSRAAGKKVTGASDGPLGNDPKALAFLYPYGATLTVMKPAVAVLSTGSECFPFNWPVLAFHEGKGTGKLVVLGSCHMFSEQYVGKEENSKIMDVVLQWLTTDSISLNRADADAPVISEYTPIPDTGVLSEKLRLVLNHKEAQSRDFPPLFDIPPLDLHSFLSLPRVIGAYKELSVKYEPLQLMKRHIEAPLPRLQLAVSPPTLRDLPPPVLEHFDLNEAFFSVRDDFAQLTSKYIYDD
ncbi:unnamed protein product, partial [Tetraodon nigroviridis]